MAFRNQAINVFILVFCVSVWSVGVHVCFFLCLANARDTLSLSSRAPAGIWNVYHYGKGLFNVFSMISNLWIGIVKAWRLMAQLTFITIPNVIWNGNDMINSVKFHLNNFQCIRCFFIFIFWILNRFWQMFQHCHKKKTIYT